MYDIPQEVLEAWPRLKTLQAEVASLEHQSARAQSKAAQLQAQLPAARDRDLDDAAKAVRKGTKQDEPTHEAKLRRELEDAQRNARVLERAAQAAQTDLAAHIARHRDALYNDVRAAQQRHYNLAAEAARVVKENYGKARDLDYLLKDLAPTTPHDENAPAGNSVHVIGVHTSRGVPDRGQVEQPLEYVISLERVEEASSAA